MNTEKLSELVSKVTSWAEDRNLVEGSTILDQKMKLIQELGELSDSICKGKDATDDIGDNIVVLIIMCAQASIDAVNSIEVAHKQQAFMSKYECDRSTKAGADVYLRRLAKICAFRPTFHEISAAIRGLLALCRSMNLDPVECLEHSYNEIKDRKGRMIDGVFVKEQDL